MNYGDELAVDVRVIMVVQNFHEIRTCGIKAMFRGCWNEVAGCFEIGCFHSWVS